jgi:hypothetical protein
MVNGVESKPEQKSAPGQGAIDYAVPLNCASTCFTLWGHQVFDPTLALGEYIPEFENYLRETLTPISIGKLHLAGPKPHSFTYEKVSG